MRVLAIDPGSEETAYALIDGDTRRPIEVAKVANDDMRLVLVSARIKDGADRVGIEMVASYGMPVGAEVFETCVWIGRFVEIVGAYRANLIYRRDVKLHHCHDSKANDSNITQALVDRFATGQPNKGKGTIANPGWFYGFKKDIWQAYALAVLVADRAAGGVW